MYHPVPILEEEISTPKKMLAEHEHEQAPHEDDVINEGGGLLNPPEAEIPVAMDEHVENQPIVPRRSTRVSKPPGDWWKIMPRAPAPAPEDFSSLCRFNACDCTDECDCGRQGLP